MELTIYQFAKDGGIDRQRVDRAMANVKPAREKGRNRYFTLNQFLHALMPTTGGRRADSTLEAERIRLTREQADKLERERKLEAKETFLASDIVPELNDIIVACKTRLLAVPQKLAMQLAAIDDPVDIQEMIFNEMSNALDDLAKMKDVGGAMNE